MLAFMHKDLQGYGHYFRERKQKEAVAAAFKRVENRLNEIRDASKAISNAGVSGAGLPHRLFDSGDLKFPFPNLAANNAPARDAYLQSLKNLLAGGVGWFRNSFDHEPHNLPDFDDGETLEQLFVASYMLRLIDRSLSAPADRPKVSAKPAPEAKNKTHLQFRKAEVKDGPARFRLPSQPLGKQWSFNPLTRTPAEEVFLSKGSAIWLRVFPSVGSGKKWSSDELRPSGGPIDLVPFVMSGVPSSIRAVDGIGMYSRDPSNEGVTNSVAFAFETGEVWSVDTELMTYFPDGIPVGEIEKLFADHLLKYGRYIASLGLDPPFHFIAGISNVKGRSHRARPATPQSIFTDLS